MLYIASLTNRPRGAMYLCSLHTCHAGMHRTEPAATRLFGLRPDRRGLQTIVVVGLAQRAVRDRLRHERRYESRRQRMIPRHRDRRDRLLEGFIQHARARNLLRHLLELLARQCERIDPSALEQTEYLVVGLIAGHLGILQMRHRAAHGGRVVDGRDLDSSLVEGREIRDGRAWLDDVSGV